MNRLLRFPILSAVLAAAWIALAGGFSVQHVLLAAILAITIPLVAAPFIDHLPKVTSVRAVLRLVVRVTWDIVLANVAVARLVLGPRDRLRPAFVEVPLALTHPQSIALLASIVTMTPGTVSAELVHDGRTLVVHALDCEDAGKLVTDIKQRYEKPLLEIFQC